MKNIIYIALLFICSISFGQYTVRHQGNTVMYNGKVVRIQADDMPDYSTPDPEPNWEDSIDYTIHYHEDFEDFPTTSVATATYPVGVPETALATYLDNFLDLQSDDANDPDMADNIDIMDIEGSRAMVNWYVKDMCCTGSAGDVNANGTGDNIGTGVHIECTMDNARGGIVIIGWNEFRPDTFQLDAGMKNTGVRNYLGDSVAMARTMTINSQTEFDEQIYSNAYWNGFGNDAVRQQNTKSLDPELWGIKGEWVHYTIAANLGTEGNSDGWIELFINGVMPDPTVWPPANRTSIPFVGYGDPTTWSIYTIETFMGGDYSFYNSPKTQFRITDDFVGYSLDNPADYGYPHSPGDHIYLPTICNYPKQD